MGYQDDEGIRDMLKKYCPICGRHIVPANIDDVASGRHDGFVYVHDDLDHDESDIRALDLGLQ